MRFVLKGNCSDSDYAIQRKPPEKIILFSSGFISAFLVGEGNAFLGTFFGAFSASCTKLGVNLRKIVLNRNCAKFTLLLAKLAANTTDSTSFFYRCTLIGV